MDKEENPAGIGLFSWNFDSWPDLELFEEIEQRKESQSTEAAEEDERISDQTMFV